MAWVGVWPSDRSFTRDLEASADARAVVDAVIRLAHALDLSVVAEGVETAGQRDILQKLNCDELQGFLFAGPCRPGGPGLGSGPQAGACAWVLGVGPEPTRAPVCW